MAMAVKYLLVVLLLHVLFVALLLHSGDLLELGGDGGITLLLGLASGVLAGLVVGGRLVALLLGLGVLVARVSADGLVDVGPHLLEVISGNLSLHVRAEALLKGLGARLLVFLLENAHVLSDVLSEDELLVDGGIVLLLIGVVAGELLGVVGDIETSVGGTLEDTEDLGTEGGTGKTNIEVDTEGTAVLIELVNVESALAEGDRHDLTSDLILLIVTNTSVLLEETNLLEGTAAGKETGGVGSGVVLVAGLGTEALELLGVGGGEDVVTSDGGVDNLGDHLLAGDAGDKAVLGGIVLVLGVLHQALALVVVGETGAATAELHLAVSCNLFY